MDDQASQQKKNDQEMRNIIEEARCILPGLQAVFGFQTIAVFNERFNDLELYAQSCHMAGLALMVIAMALLMTPAVYYRAQHGNATSRMVNVARKSIRGALMPLALGLSLDMLTVVSLATDNLTLSIVAAVASLLLFVGLWYLVPRSDPVQIGEPPS
jgi:cytochrome bd-type quinol oxidase subunit 2